MTVNSLNMLADKMLDKFGESCYISSVVLGEYDSLTDEYIKSETITDGLIAFITSKGTKYNDRYIVKDGEKLAIIKSNVAINRDATIIYNGKKYVQNESEELSFKGTVIVYKVVLKEED